MKPRPVLVRDVCCWPTITSITIPQELNPDFFSGKNSAKHSAFQVWLQPNYFFYCYPNLQQTTTAPTVTLSTTTATSLFQRILLQPVAILTITI